MDGRVGPGISSGDDVRYLDHLWYDNYIVLVSALVVAGIGVVYGVVLRPYAKGGAPAGDAVEQAAGTPGLAAN
jgi:hypothetical protein